MKPTFLADNLRFGKRAIVIGAGIGGLSASRVLSDYFDEVLVMDRDELPDKATTRPGVPQGTQPHGLLGGGLKALEALFPGFGDELARAGAIPIDPLYDVLNQIPGLPGLPRLRGGWRTYAMSRPLIEGTLRRLVEQIDNVKIMGGRKVEAIVGDSTGSPTGIVYQAPSGGGEQLTADFIVDASGNGSLTLDFLKTSGRELPEETAIEVNIRYASTLFERTEIVTGHKCVFTLPKAPDDSRAAALFPAEGNTFQMLLGGRTNDAPPTDPTGYLQFARRLPTSTVYDTIRHARRLTEITPFSFRASRWRHFNQVPDFPDRLLPIGDAICRFNPIYGQGMSVAAKQAEFLSELFKKSGDDQSDRLVPTFLTEVEGIIAHPWTMSALPDFVYPDTVGQRPPDLKDRLNFHRGCMRLAARDVQVLKLMTQVRHLLKPLSALDDPAFRDRVKAEMENAVQTELALEGS